jgi:hypothetical protein
MFPLPLLSRHETRPLPPIVQTLCFMAGALATEVAWIRQVMNIGEST